MGRCENGAVRAVCQCVVGLCVFAGQYGEAGRAPALQFNRLRADGAAVLQPDNVWVFCELQHRVIAEIDAGPVGDVVDHHRMGCLVGQCAEVPDHSGLCRS